ncbi:MAG: hypothetical protein IPM81_22695 [Saprospirales bacterium]|nr:hypothetical protein [Saprospirales bacterium]
MMRILKQRWVIAVLAVGATLLFITYVYPKIKKATAGKVPGTNTTTDPSPATGAPVLQSLKSRLVGPVSASSN